MNLSTFLAFRNPVLNFLNFLSSRALLSYKPLSYRKPCITNSKLKTRGEEQKLSSPFICPPSYNAFPCSTRHVVILSAILGKVVSTCLVRKSPFLNGECDFSNYLNMNIIELKLHFIHEAGRLNSIPMPTTKLLKDHFLCMHRN